METVKKTKRKPTGAAAMGAGPGRPKGVPNKATTEFRETVAAMLANNASNVELWLQQVANGHGDTKPAPEKALDLMAKLAEFAAPKLARTEIANADDQAFKTVSLVQYEVVNPKG